MVLALTTYIDSRPEDEYTRWNLTTFKDSPTDVGTTDDRGQVLSLVSALRASGGVTPSSLWPPDHKMVEITPTATATDNLDPHPTVELVGIEVSQPDDGQGDGNTAGDVQVTADGRIFVRAERSATSGTRVYTVTYRATDASGNVGHARPPCSTAYDPGGRLVTYALP